MNTEERMPTLNELMSPYELDIDPFQNTKEEEYAQMMDSLRFEFDMFCEMSGEESTDEAFNAWIHSPRSNEELIDCDDLPF